MVARLSPPPREPGYEAKMLAALVCMAVCPRWMYEAVGEGGSQIWFWLCDTGTLASIQPM